MSEFTTAARPYANAVYDIAHETKTLGIWGDALSNLSALITDAQMGKLLDKPELGKKQKGELIIQVLGDKLTEQQKNLVRLMAENGRLKLLPAVREQFEVARAKAENKVDAQVISAFELTAKQTSANISN